MSSVDVSDPAWYAAISLPERLASLRAAGGIQSSTETNVTLARRRLERWRSAAPLTSDVVFRRRLAADSMTADEFLHLLGEPLDVVRDRYPQPPRWLAGLARAFAQPHAPTGLPLVPPAGPTERARSVDALLDAVAPLIRDGRARLRDGVRALSRSRAWLPFDAAQVDALLLADLVPRLAALLQPTLAQVQAEWREQGLIHGSSPEEQAEEFLRRVRQPDVALAVLRAYPLLARLVVECIDQWLAFSLDFLRHLCDDWPAIRAAFGDGSSPGVLTALIGGAGDRHRGGRAVQIALFSSGLKLVYKPRSLAIDVHFQQTLEWLNNLGLAHPFRTLRILDRGSHGWSEFVPVRGCTSADAVRRFYHRMGGYLALLHALAGTDMHDENVIAAGEYPILVDLETLFQPAVEQFDAREADAVARRWLSSSVLPTGLLPVPLYQTDTAEGVDISAVGTNRPALNGRRVDPADYLDDVVAGFAEAYELLVRHRDAFLADDGPVARFAQDEARLLLRPTRAYVTFLDRSRLPSLLRNAIHRDCLFDWLWSKVDAHPYLERVITAEQDDLRRGDIPMFVTHPRSPDLWTSQGERIPGVVEEPALALVRRRVQDFNQADRERQEWAIRAAFTSLPGAAPSTEHRAPRSPAPVPRSAPTADREQVLAAACAIGDRLETLALRGADDACWIGLGAADGHPPSVISTGADLYSGVPGIALFLAYLGVVSGDERYPRLARAALRTLRRQVARHRSMIVSLGAIHGWGGIIYTLTHLAALWREPDLLDEAERLVPVLAGRIGQDEQIHVAGGAAGCILALAGLYRQTGSKDVLTVAMRCGDHILERAQPTAAGVGWPPPATAGGPPLTGMARGAAGIAYALLVLAGVCGDERFRAAALDAMAYERSLFSPVAGNWPDLRGASRGDAPRFRTAWCHGAPGIGLARLRSLAYVDDPAIRAEIDAALATTLAAGFGWDHSLCHGDLGRLDLLLAAAEALDQPRWRSHVQHMVAGVLGRAAAGGWLCGVPLGVETPGLMTGLAGIGYELLRVAEPARVPSVLALAPPPTASA